MELKVFVLKFMSFEASKIPFLNIILAQKPTFAPTPAPAHEPKKLVINFQSFLFVFVLIIIFGKAFKQLVIVSLNSICCF